MKYKALKELFYALSGALLIFFMLEMIKPGLILAYIKINLVLIFWLFIGIVILLINPKNNTLK